MCTSVVGVIDVSASRVAVVRKVEYEEGTI
jgi:hypothetical protein